MYIKSGISTHKLPNHAGGPSKTENAKREIYIL